MEDFTLVTRKKGRRKTKDDKNTTLDVIPCTRKCPANSDDEKDAFDRESFERSVLQIANCRTEIQRSNFWQDVKAQLLEIDEKWAEIISYGAGHFASCPNARYQFALLSLFAHLFENQGSVHVYDPIFTANERKLVEHFGFHLIEENEECKRKITKPTVIFMLHCGKAMYENMIKANWGIGLQNLLIIGNTFSSYIERLPSKILKAEAPYLFDIIPYTQEYILKNSFIHKDIFNDTAFIRFPRDKLLNIEDEFWASERTATPIDDETEMITKSRISGFVS
eukprot:Seg2500.3 transcript_id=Seg2500.3/GoldUCD/mRNA.D3Y31 product="SRR1-like protein" protein_id=Seg2500.3/GoldUCD/D3Y31